MATIHAVRLTLVRDRRITVGSVRIRNASDAATVIRAHMGYGPDSDPDVEMLVVLGLGTRLSVNFVHTVAIGGLNACRAEPRDVFRAAIAGGAAAIIVAHNHPSGDTTPSEADRLITRRLVMAGQLLGIDLLDHVVVGPDRYNSLRDNSPQLWQEAREVRRLAADNG